MLASQSFDLTEDQPHAHWSTPKIKSILSAQPNEPEFANFGLLNEELNPFSDYEYEIFLGFIIWDFFNWGKILYTSMVKPYN